MVPATEIINGTSRKLICLQDLIALEIFGPSPIIVQLVSDLYLISLVSGLKFNRYSGTVHKSSHSDIIDRRVKFIL